MSIIPIKEGAKETKEPQNHWLVEILGLERAFWERVSKGVRPHRPRLACPSCESVNRVSFRRFFVRVP